MYEWYDPFRYDFRAMVFVFIFLDIPVWTRAFAFVGVPNPLGHALCCAAMTISVCFMLDMAKKRAARKTRLQSSAETLDSDDITCMGSSSNGAKILKAD